MVFRQVSGGLRLVLWDLRCAVWVCWHSGWWVRLWGVVWLRCLITVVGLLWVLSRLASRLGFGRFGW